MSNRRHLVWVCHSDCAPTVAVPFLFLLRRASHFPPPSSPRSQTIATSARHSVNRTFVVFLRLRRSDYAPPRGATTDVIVPNRFTYRGKAPRRSPSHSRTLSNPSPFPSSHHVIEPLFPYPLNDDRILKTTQTRGRTGQPTSRQSNPLSKTR